ncbi:probable methyltransferase PMT11 [Macadamia integrifolia]|uniref:probable methyltransferase PMT11 n=1 Tax=Macadamia integrifolia TaxID=60698 RepID=UPI001C530F5D|nr:probable methyltransferase PMT11 [Macadamia integrifolia]
MANLYDLETTLKSDSEVGMRECELLLPFSDASMRSFDSGDVFRALRFIWFLTFALMSYGFFFLDRHWSDRYQLVVFFNSQQFNIGNQITNVDFSPNANKEFDLSKSIAKQTDKVPDSKSPPSAPPPAEVGLFERIGIVDENGIMTEEFEIGGFDPDVVENFGNDKEIRERKSEGTGVRVKKFELCPASMRDYIPCLDNVDDIKKLKTTKRGESFERHCPGEGKNLNCLVPAPEGYRTPIPWPRSRDEVQFSNVPDTCLVEDKGGQNSIKRVGDKLKISGGGTQFIHGADLYLHQIVEMVPDVAFGHHTRVTLDVGCGVANFGADLLSWNVITMSIAPKDVHKNQIQFALERGVPAMVAAFATHCLLYPSQAFDLIHCSRCRINWTRDDGILLLEANRMLRAGGYFVWAAHPVYQHEENREEQWKEMVDLTVRLCWELVRKKGYLAIWQKPMNNSCYVSRDPGAEPPLCDPDDDPDNVWNVRLKACITRLPENGNGANVPLWPARLQNPPDRLQTIQMDAYISRKELFKAESNYWNDIIRGYARAFHWKKMKVRNVMDMKAGFGGFAAALIGQQIDCWVMNVVPVSGPNTLPIIYDRGLVGVMHDWCEPFDTYPRTYDLLHAANLFSIEKKRCNISVIMLEMDRILRPGGRVYIRDTVSVIGEVQEVGKAMEWHTVLRDTSEGPYSSWKILTCDKPLLHA